MYVCTYISKTSKIQKLAKPKEVNLSSNSVNKIAFLQNKLRNMPHGEMIIFIMSFQSEIKYG